MEEAIPTDAGLTFEKVWLLMKENEHKFEKWDSKRKKRVNLTGRKRKKSVNSSGGKPMSVLKNGCRSSTRRPMPSLDAWATGSVISSKAWCVRGWCGSSTSGASRLGKPRSTFQIPARGRGDDGG